MQPGVGHRGEDRVHDSPGREPGDVPDVVRGQALSLHLVEILGLQLAGIGGYAQDVFHEGALALGQGEYGRIGAEAVERRLVEAEGGELDPRGAEAAVTPPGVGDQHEGNPPGLPGERRRACNLPSRFSAVTRASRILGVPAYAIQLLGMVSMPRRRLSSSSHWRASGVMSSSLGTSKKAIETPSGVPLTIDHASRACKAGPGAEARHQPSI